MLTNFCLSLSSFNHDKMKRLIDFVTVMPPDDAGQKRGHKYVYIHLLCLQNKSITQARGFYHAQNDSFFLLQANLILLFRYPFLALEIFNCEINPMLEKFFEAPEPKQAAAEKEDLPIDSEPASQTDNDFNFDYENKADKDDSTKEKEETKDEESKDEADKATEDKPASSTETEQAETSTETSADSTSNPEEEKKEETATPPTHSLTR